MAELGTSSLLLVSQGTKLKMLMLVIFITVDTICVCHH